MTSLPRIGSAALATFAAVLALGACGGGSGTATFEWDPFPFTFEYPDTFELHEDSDVTVTELGGAADETLALGIDEDNLLILQRSTLNREIDAANLGLASRELDELVREFDVGAPAGEEGEIAGFPALTYRSVTLAALEAGESRVHILFDGLQEYVINCQSTPQHRDQVESACDQALKTLAPRPAQ